MAYTIILPTFRGFERDGSFRSLQDAESNMQSRARCAYGQFGKEFIVGPQGEFHASCWSDCQTDPRAA